MKVVRSKSLCDPDPNIVPKDRSMPARKNAAVASREEQRKQWLNKNRAALEAYNEHIERDGVFSDRMRSF